MYIHRHSRKRVISIFREQNPFKRQEAMTPAVSILFSPRDLQSFHTRNRPKVQYHDEASRTRLGGSSRNVSEEPAVPAIASTSSQAVGQEHTYPPTFRGTASPPAPAAQQQLRVPSSSSRTPSEEGHHRRGHAEAFSVTERMQTSSITSIASVETIQPPKPDRGGNGLTSLFKRRGKSSSEKAASYQPPWLVLPQSAGPQTEEEMERMMFGSLTTSSDPPPSTLPPAAAPSRANHSDATATLRPVASAVRSPPEETEDEKQQRRVRNLSQSFESVGLIATKKPKHHASSSNVARERERHGHSRPSQPTFLEALPPDSTCFLLPLWPSEATSRKHERPLPAYRVPVDERRYLVVYLVQQSQLSSAVSPNRPAGAMQTNKKRTRQGQTPAPAQAAMPSNNKHGFTPFHVCAKLLTSDDLMQAGMRSLDKGLLIPGSISDGLLVVPDTPPSDAQGPIIIALCNETQALELVPEGLDKLGLRVEDEEHEEEGDDDAMGINAWANPPPAAEKSLTSIGRAVVEIIWAACVAVSAPGPGS